MPPTVEPPASDIDPGQLERPWPGAYRLRVVSEDAADTGSLTVDASGREVLQVADSRWWRVLGWTDSGGALLESHDAAEPACDWLPAPLAVPADMREGRSWTTNAACTTDGPDGPTNITRNEDAAVTGRARTTVDGTPVDCWLVRRHVVEQLQSAGARVTTESVRSELFAPRLGLTVYAVERMDVPSSNGSVQSAIWSTELLDMRPSE